MNVVIKLDCAPDNQLDVFRHSSALLVSTKTFKDYNNAKDVLIGLEPEKYAEQWIRHSILAADSKFEDLILIYFIKILQASQNE